MEGYVQLYTLNQTSIHAPEVISWDSIIETLMDDDFLQRNNEEAASAHLVRGHLMKCETSLTFCSLCMVYRRQLTGGYPESLTQMSRNCR